MSPKSPSRSAHTSLLAFYKRRPVSASKFIASSMYPSCRVIKDPYSCGTFVFSLATISVQRRRFARRESRENVFLIARRSRGRGDFMEPCIGVRPLVKQSFFHRLERTACSRYVCDIIAKGDARYEFAGKSDGLQVRFIFFPPFLFLFVSCAREIVARARVLMRSRVHFSSSPSSASVESKFRNDTQGARDPSYRFTDTTADYTSH